MISMTMAFALPSACQAANQDNIYLNSGMGVSCYYSLYVCMCSYVSNTPSSPRIVYAHYNGVRGCVITQILVALQHCCSCCCCCFYQCNTMYMPSLRLWGKNSSSVWHLPKPFACHSITGRVIINKQWQHQQQQPSIRIRTTERQ